MDSVGSGYNSDFREKSVQERVERELRFLNCKFMKVVVKWILQEVATLMIFQ